MKKEDRILPTKGLRVLFWVALVSGLVWIALLTAGCEKEEEESCYKCVTWEEVNAPTFSRYIALTELHCGITLDEAKIIEQAGTYTIWVTGKGDKICTTICKEHKNQ